MKDLNEIFRGGVSDNKGDSYYTPTKVMIGTLEVNPVFIKPPFLTGISYRQFMKSRIGREEFIKKVKKKKFCNCIKFGSWRLYITRNIRLRARKERDYNQNIYEQRNLRRAVYERSQGICECCGKPVSLEDGQMHHILPVGKFKELCCDMNNVQFLCIDCHRTVHNNPFTNLRQQLDKAEEYGIDLYKHYNE